MSNTEGSPLLELDDVSVHYKRETAVRQVIPDRIKKRFGLEAEVTRAVDDVSFEVDTNDVVAIIGESGSGKTTLGKTAVGLQAPTSGSVRYRGYDIWETRRDPDPDGLQFEDIRRALQIIHQDPDAALNPYRTISSSLRQPLEYWNPELTNADYRERILSLFERCGLTPVEDYEKRYPYELSGGEKQRVVLIRSMLLEPSLILADEPVSALDTSLTVDILDLMLELQDVFETSYLLVTHDVESARYIAEKADGKVGVMYMSNLVEFGTVEEVLENPKHPYTQILRWADLPMNPYKAREIVATETPLRKTEITDPDQRPSGCRFHPRCPKARTVCRDENPRLETANGHEAACFREHEGHEYWDSEPIDEELEIPSRT